MLVIDMQAGSFVPAARKHDGDGTVARINALARSVRAAHRPVVFIQHDAEEGEEFAPGTAAWQLLASLDRDAQDAVVHKRACDAFYQTELKAVLDAHQIREILVTRSAPEYCVDTTVRAGASLDYQVVVVADGHTTSEREHLDARSIIAHHNITWSSLILPEASVQVRPVADLVASVNGMALAV